MSDVVIHVGDKFAQTRPFPTGMTLEVEEVRDEGRLVIRRANGLRQLVPEAMLLEYWERI